MSLSQIQSDPAYSQFRFEIVEAYNTEYPAGVVYDQTPKAPKQVKENAQVILRVSLGTQVVTLPPTVNMTKSEAQKMLQDMGLGVIIKTQENTEVTPGIVLSMDPVAGTQMETGKSVTLYISREYKANSDTVPDVLGMDTTAAQAVLQAKKFYLGTTTEVESDAPAGTIVAQSPQAGTTAYYGDSIHVSVSIGYVNTTRNVTVKFDSSNDGGTWTLLVNGETHTLSAEAGVASEAVLSFTNHGTYDVQLCAPSGEVVQTAVLNFGSDGGDITFTIKGNTVPKHDHVWSATDPATGQQTCSVCHQTQKDPSWTASSASNSSSHG
jgi:serine/threonine-protein kinase